MATKTPHGRTRDAEFMFVKLEVHDLEASAAFYTDVFGLVELRRIEAVITGRPISEICYRPTYAGGALFVLAKFHDTEKPAHKEVIIGFSVDDLDAAMDRATSAGGQIAEYLETPDYGNLAFIRDPEGHLIQVNQRLG
jgi:lactoylglutathione lyase